MKMKKFWTGEGAIAITLPLIVRTFKKKLRNNSDSDSDSNLNKPRTLCEKPFCRRTHLRMTMTVSMTLHKMRAFGVRIPALPDLRGGGGRALGTCAPLWVQIL